MDPHLINTNDVLDELRGLFNMTTPHQPMHRMRIAELFQRLDNALCNGGRYPDAWANGVRSLEYPQAPYKCPVCEGIHQLPLCKAPSVPSVIERYRCTKCPEKFGSVLALADHRLSRDH